VQVYWGDGKGKTTASMGLIARALGRNFKVHLVQFMKCGLEGNNDFLDYGELVSLEKLDGFSVKRFGFKEWVIGTPKKEHVEEAGKALDYSKKIIYSGEYDLVVLDEVLYAMQLMLIKEAEVLELISAKHENTELVLTGSHKAFPRIFEKADLVTEMKKIKHPYDKGVLARKGIEF